MKTFLEWLEGGKFADGVQYDQSDFSVSAGEVPFLADVRKLDSGWSRDSGYYIPTGSASEKYRAAVARLESGSATMPRVGFVDGKVAFTDGRHTMAAVRDSAKKRIWVAVERDQLGLFVWKFS